MTDATELSLISDLKRGEESAFRKLVESHQSLVYNTALGIVQNPEDAEDVSQEVFAQAFESIGSFKGEAKISTWLYRITLTKAMDHLRRKKRKKRFAFVQSLFGHDESLIVDPPDFVHPGVKLDQKENASVLFRAIAELPENQKIAFTLNKIEGLNYQQISEVMQTTVPSIESLLHRAKRNLRKILETRLGDNVRK
jgi:RNA polymerase sigma factor (sigma-70 family)